jgi:hypothetical protein
MDERVYAEVTPVGNGRVEQAWRSPSSATQQLAKSFKEGRIGGELRTHTVNCAVRSPLVILNETLRPRHKVLQFSKPVSKRHEQAAPTLDSKQRGPDLPSRPACFSIRFS